MPRACVAVGVWAAGGWPVQIKPGDEECAGDFDGVVITGGHDVDPVLYAQESKVLPHYDADRDAFESAIIDDALARGLPLLGICRGAQLMNVRLGGDLHQDLRSQRRHTSNRRTIFPMKTLLLEPDTLLFELFGMHRARINSLHNQSIDRLGAGLRICGRDLDGIVQAVEDPERKFLLGVQWHPEFLLFSREQRRLFAALVAACDPARTGSAATVESSREAGV